nr:retrovirus-related Pol polyprotein from transposon TNT 1-94 [Tanacetum cinerariifolium]
MHGVQVQLVMGELRIELGMKIQPKRPHKSEYFKDKMLLMQAQENRVALDEEQLLFIVGGQDNAVDKDVDEQLVQDLALNVDNVFHADECDAFDYDVDEAPTAQTLFMVNLSSADPVYDKAGLSYDSDILSEVHDHDYYQDAICEHHEVHEMHDNVQLNYVVDSHADYTIDSNMILSDQYNNVVDKSLTAKLATYKEQVELYKKQAKFELTEREQKIDEQFKIAITDCNIKKENLKKELHCVKMQLTSTINHNKSMVEEVKSLKKDFKQKENKYLEEFLDMKALKEKVEDKLYKQDQSLQTVYMLCKPKPYYDEQNRVQSKDNTIRELREKISRLTKKHSDADPIPDLKALDSQNKELHAKVYALHDLNERWRVENEKVTRHYKELYDLIKITRAKTIDKTNSLLTEVINLKAQITKYYKLNCVTMPALKSKVLALGMYVIDVEPIPPHNWNNREVHLDYLKHLKESVATLREII